MKKILLITSLVLLTQTIAFSVTQQVAILGFKANDRPSNYVTKNMMKRDFEKIFDDNEKLELISLKKSEKAFEASGVSDLSFLGSEEVGKIGEELQADIVVWGDVYEGADNDFKVIAKIMSTKSKSVESAIFNVTKKSSERRDKIEIELLARLETMGQGEIEEVKNIAMQHFNSKNYTSAYENFTKLLQLDPQNVEAYFFLGIISFINTEFQEAINYFEQGLDIDPDNIDILNYLSKSYKQVESFEDAIESLEKIADIEPENAEIWLRIGDIYEEMEYYQEAQEALETAIEIKDDYGEAYQKLALLLYDQESFNDAIFYLEEATEYFPEDDDLQKKLAKCYFKTNRLDEAIENYKKVLAEQPENTSAYFNLAGAYRVSNKNEKALEVLLQLKDLKPENQKVYLRLADGYIALKRYDEASKNAKQAIEIDPEHHEAYLVLAFVNQSLGYAKYEQYLDYEEKYKDKSVYYGKKADELVEKRDKVKSEAYDYFVKSEEYLDQAAEKTKDTSVLKDIKAKKQTLNQLKNATKKGAF